MTKIDRERFQALMDKYLNASISIQEEMELDRYYKCYEKEILPFEKAYYIEKQLSKNIALRAFERQKSKAKKDVRRKPLLTAVAAISVLMVLGISSLVWYSSDQVDLITETTVYGERKQVLLPDSSLVTLNAGSSITYPSVFGADVREIKLLGEAFFEVTHDAQKPFLVSSSGLKTQVLGTSFNIKAYKDAPSIKISLSTGAIRIYRQNEILARLKPDEQILYDKNSGQYAISGHETDKDISWLQNTIELDDHSLEETRRILERWFNVEISISKGPDKKQTITGKFIDPSLEETIKSLELLTNSKINYTKRVEPIKDSQ